MREYSLGIPNYASWDEVELHKVTTLLRRGTAPAYVEESTVHAVGQRCVREWGFDPTEARPHDARLLRSSVVIEPGDVLLNSTGTGTIGRSCLFDRGGSYIADSHITLLRGDSERVDPRWINILLRSPWGQSHLESHCYVGSTNQIELSRVELSRTKIPVPPINEQRQMADILEATNNAISAAIRVLDKQQQLASSQVSNLLRTMEWRALPLHQCIRPGTTITYGIVQAGPHVEGGVPYIRTGDMSGDRLTPDGLLRTSPEIAASYSRSRLEEGDLVFSIRATVGKVLPTPKELAGANLTQGTARVAPSDGLFPGYLMWALRSQPVRSQLVAMVKGTTFPEITLGQLRSLAVPIPCDASDQEKIVRIANSQEESISSEGVRLAKLRRLRFGLMSDLLTGRVRVPVDIKA